MPKVQENMECSRTQKVLLLEGSWQNRGVSFPTSDTDDILSQVFLCDREHHVLLIGFR